MKIENDTTIMKTDKNEKRLRITIPAIIRDIMNLKAGDKFHWEMENEKEIKITLKRKVE